MLPPACGASDLSSARTVRFNWGGFRWSCASLISNALSISERTREAGMNEYHAQLHA